jgi:hypothetical protein
MLPLALGMAMGLFGADGPSLPPHVPFTDTDTCTAECCTYGAWTANAATTVHALPDPGSAVIAQVGKGAPVRAIRGIVVTSHLGVTEVLKPVTLGFQKDGDHALLSLGPGDKLLTLHRMGEGYVKFWYQGKVYSDQIELSPDGFGDLPFAGALKVVSRPVATWWVEIVDGSGKRGWVDQPTAFAGSDGCS